MPKILIADDEPDLELIIRQKFRSKIREGALQFEFAENGAVALEKLRLDPEIELVFTDINMPVMDGLSLLAKIQGRDSITKSVVVSAYGDVKNIRTAMNRGAFDFITKPIDLEDLEATLFKALQEIEVLKQGLEAKSKLEQALIEKTKAQEEALFNLIEKEKLILRQNEMLETQVKERTLEIHEQKELIEAKNLEILDSIRYAKRLQEAILPPSQMLHDLFPENFILYYPKDIVAGDFYWFGTAQGKHIVVAADCTGHGVSGALMSMLGMSLLNQIVTVDHLSDPALILDRLHRDVVIALNQDENESREGMDIIVCAFDVSLRSMNFAGANRPLWIVRNNELISYPTDKMPVGGLQIENRPLFTKQHLELISGDKMYLFTDGYGDQFGGEKGKKFMTKKMKELLTETSSLSAEKQSLLIAEAFHRWKGDLEQVDDVLVIGLQVG
jgi:serine phosphatase RsbU (regulator of sigma subunit)